MKVDFQKKLSSLTAPSESLRWLPLSDDANLIHILLVTPFGPCADMVGNSSSKMFSIVKMPGKPENRLVSSKVLGNYSSQNLATSAAETYCTDRYASELSSSRSTFNGNELWFTPKTESPDILNNTQSPTQEQVTPEKIEEPQPDSADRN